MTRNYLQSGFTIVELVIVVSVIAILAAITIVSYDGIKERSNETAVKSDLIDNRNKLLEHKAATGRFPASRTNTTKNSTSCDDGTSAGQVSSTGWYCPIVSNGASGNFNNSNLATSGGRGFSLTIGKGDYAYTIDEEGVISSQKCTQNTGQGAVSGYSKVYDCPSGSLSYSQ